MIKKYSGRAALFVNTYIIIYIILSLLILSCNQQEEIEKELGETFNHTTSNGSKRVWISPDRKYRCYTIIGFEGYGQQLILNDIRANDKSILWSSGRWIDISWCPDSIHLAVIDHWDPDQSELRIFDITKRDKNGNYCLLYQTPTDNIIQTRWDLIRWNPDNTVLLLEEKNTYDDADHIYAVVDIKYEEECIDYEMNVSD